MRDPTLLIIDLRTLQAMKSTICNFRTENYIEDRHRISTKSLQISMSVDCLANETNVLIT